MMLDYLYLPVCSVLENRFLIDAMLKQNPDFQRYTDANIVSIMKVATSGILFKQILMLEIL